MVIVRVFHTKRTEFQPWLGSLLEKLSIIGWGSLVPVGTGEFRRELVGRTHRSCLVINGKYKMAERGQVSNFSQRNGNHISFLPSTMILECSERMYVTYTSETFPDPRNQDRFSSGNVWDFFSLNWDVFAILCQAFSPLRSVPSLLLSPG